MNEQASVHQPPVGCVGRCSCYVPTKTYLSMGARAGMKKTASKDEFNKLRCKQCGKSFVPTIPGQGFCGHKCFGHYIKEKKNDTN